ncbi:MAG: hypothetical protein H6R13_228 [Proteobacteria bacterium]|nr:hypothetical protein [Pseudomonadota bacterium]
MIANSFKNAAACQVVGRIYLYCSKLSGMEETTTEILAPQDGEASTSDDQDALQTLQREVQRKFGRAVFILQQYERLVKSLVAETERKMAAVVGARSCMSPASLTFVVSKDSQERQL